MLFLYMCQGKKKRAENQKDETPTSLMPEFSEIFKKTGLKYVKGAVIVG